MSHMMARSNPPASAAPLTAAIIGSGNSRQVRWYRSLEAHRVRAKASSSRRSNSRRSNPAQNASPAPVRTTTLTRSSTARPSRVSLSSSRNAIDSAFFFSGRSSVRVTMPSAGPSTRTSGGTRPPYWLLAPGLGLRRRPGACRGGGLLRHPLRRPAGGGLGHDSLLRRDLLGRRLLRGRLGQDLLGRRLLRGRLRGPRLRRRRLTSQQLVDPL